MTAVRTTARHTVLFSGDLRPFPGIPGHWSAPTQRFARAVLGDVEQVTGRAIGSPEPGADVEDFWEDAARMSAAVRSARRRKADVVLSHQTNWSTEDLERRLGPVARVEEGGHHAHDHFIEHALLVEYGGRAMALAHVGEGIPAGPASHRCQDSADAVDWFVEAARQRGVTRGVLKCAQSKTGVWALDLHTDREQMRQAVLEVLGWTAVRLDGVPRSLLVQDAIDMRWEYRLFVVEGRIVTGAGNVEEHTPFDAVTRGSITHPSSQLPAFDSRMREIRGHEAVMFDPCGSAHGARSAVVARPDLVERYLDAAGTWLSHLEITETLTLDVALDHTRDEVVCVEVNSLPNSGLYASNPWLLTDALMAAVDRGYDHLLDPEVNQIATLRRAGLI